MKSIVTINTIIPGIKDSYSYTSGQSLQDYDIIIFNPELPYYSRLNFSDGSSAIDRTSGNQVTKNVNHWRNEITNALHEGKTVFFLLAEIEEDSYITGVTSSTARSTNYNITSFKNYDILPFFVNVVNGRGSKIKVIDPRFKDFFSTLEGNIKYHAYINDIQKSPIATPVSGGKPLGAIYQLKGSSGHLILIPYFNLDSFIEEDSKGKRVWSKIALGLGAKLIKNIIEVDKVLKQNSKASPPPQWVNDFQKSEFIENIKKVILDLDQEIKNKIDDKKRKEEDLQSASSPAALLYETGKPLEFAIESFLKMLGYEVSSFREGSLEIDHIIVSPEGNRLIGEAEGKDNTAVNIDKFRQLETNINEDFQREEVSAPASSILFGNGYRLQEPTKREIQFTEKCLINAKRLSTVLIQTSDLFPIAMYLQDNPNDDTFKAQCRRIIESKNGGVAVFPSLPQK